MGQGHVAGAQPVEGPELGQAVLDGHASLDADQRGDLAGADDPLDVVGREGQLQVVRVLRDQPMNQVDLLGDRPGGVGVLAGDVDRPELRLHAPLAEPGNVGLAGIEPLRQVELRQPHVPFRPQPPGQVVVAVPEHARGMDLAGTLRDRGPLVAANRGWKPGRLGQHQAKQRR